MGAFYARTFDVRIYGVVALVQSTELFARKDDSHGRRGYIDMYVWRVTIGR